MIAVLSRTQQSLAQDGAALIRNAVPTDLLTALQYATATLQIDSGLRFATAALPAAHALAFGPMLTLARSLLGPSAHPLHPLRQNPCLQLARPLPSGPHHRRA